MNTRTFGLVALFFLNAAAVSGCTAEPATGSTDSHLVDDPRRYPTTDHPSVGVIFQGGYVACTGTLIRADVVLTSAQCVRNRDSTREAHGTWYFQLAHGLYAVKATKVAPRSFAGGIASNDWAVLKISGSPGVPLPRIATTGPSRGAPIVVVGGDSRAEQDPGVMYAANARWGERLPIGYADQGSPIFDAAGDLIAIVAGESHLLGTTASTHLWDADRRAAIAAAMNALR
jgi:hypothetical protein